MRPKTALLILLFLSIAIIFFFIVAFLFKNNNIEKEEFPGVNQENIQKEELNKAIEKINQKKNLSEEEEKIIIKTVDEKLTDRIKEIERKSQEEIKEKGYTQEEIDFIINPLDTIKEELGITSDENIADNNDGEIDIQGSMPERPPE